MEPYIKKSALVAWIEKRLKEYRTFPDYQIDSNYIELCEILSFIDTLEEKELGLEKELDYKDYTNFFNEHPNYNDGDWGFDECWVFAEYFFKLGLKANEE